jgi:hypothetical protein
MYMPNLKRRLQTLDEDILVGSSNELINLNTRVTKEAYYNLEIIRGWLQTTGQIRKITKQDATDWALKLAYFEVTKQIEAKGTIDINYSEAAHYEPIQNHIEPPPVYSEPPPHDWATIPKHSEPKKKLKSIRNPFSKGRRQKY